MNTISETEFEYVLVSREDLSNMRYEEVENTIFYDRDENVIPIGFFKKYLLNNNLYVRKEKPWWKYPIPEKSLLFIMGDGMFIMIDEIDIESGSCYFRDDYICQIDECTPATQEESLSVVWRRIDE